MSEDKTDQPTASTPPEEQPTTSRYPDLDELQAAVARRLRDNQKFLDHFLDEDFPDDVVEDEEETDPDDFEEL